MDKKAIFKLREVCLGTASFAVVESIKANKSRASPKLYHARRRLELALGDKHLEQIVEGALRVLSVMNDEFPAGDPFYESEGFEGKPVGVSVSNLALALADMGQSKAVDEAWLRSKEGERAVTLMRVDMLDLAEKLVIENKEEEGWKSD